MFSRQFRNRRVRSLIGLCATLMLAGAIHVACAATPTAPNDPPDLGATPPDLNSSVDPNIVVTFDDSGSMQWTHMGDARPYDGSTDNSTWDGPWHCANAINPDITKSSAFYNVASRAMNGVAYNPNITYTPPLYEDGSSFPNADKTLKAVWQDGIAVNRPSDGNQVTATTAGYFNNPDGNTSSSSAATTNLMGTTTTPITLNCESNGTGNSGCPSANYGYTVTCPAGILGNPNYVAGSCVKKSGTCSYGDCHWNYKLNDIADRRWMCGAGGTSGTSGDGRWTADRATQNPFDGTGTNPLSGGSKQNGGPVYWRFKSSALNLLTTDATTGALDTAGKAALYDVGNWEAVAVPVSQYQNFANWYAYYRYRNLMARSAMARVFGVIGTRTSANIRVAWQNLGNNDNFNSNNPQLPSSTIITNLDDNTTFNQIDGSGNSAGTVGYRHAFFNWIYNIKDGSGTPTRQAAIRAGEFFKRVNTGDLKDPYWQPGSGGQAGQELACRQNFHMLMTDGLYNGGTAYVNGSSPTPTSKSVSPIGPAPTNPLLAEFPAHYTANASGANPTSIYYGGADGDGSDTYSNIAFYYWATNLRPDLSAAGATTAKDSVPQYFPDQTVGVTGSATATVSALDPGATAEVFWNPLNDPATWPHVVQFAVTLGAFGTLKYSDDLDCNLNDGFGVGNDDACKLREGVTNSSGSVGWPQPNGSANGGNGEAQNIDDLWHAAINSRGAFFVATDPSSLVQHLTDIIQSVLARSQASTGETASGSILPAQGTVNGFSGGYDSGSWHGYLFKYVLDSTTAVATSAEWDAGCTLTGGAFTPIAPSSVKQPSGSCKVAATPPDESTSRVIFTSTGISGSALTGVPFTYASLVPTDQAFMDFDPTTTDPDGATGIVTGTPDLNGPERVDYLRGKRLNETTPTTETLPRQFRIRKSLLGPIINSQAIYEAGPAGGFSDLYPSGSPEEVAAKPCIAGGVAASGCNSYEKFVDDNIGRTPVVYVGANDGMLHAFDASGNATTDGKELWAYVPHMLYANGQLDQLTNTKSTLTTTVDDTPLIQDVFTATPNDSTAKWRTILVGSMRLGGRGIYALDITDQSAPASDTAAASKFMWEFTNANDPDLGYTYASANIARIRCGSGTSTLPTNCTKGGTWVVIVASGYYPQKLQVQSATNGNNQTLDTSPGASANITHLWILNAGTGAVIKKIDTPAGTISYGLSTPVVVDFGLDQIDDVAVAGDLAGNLWRFDLSDPDSANWTAVNMFQAYANTTPCSTSNKQGLGCEPISVMPVAFPDTTTGSVIYVFGSGQYLGPSDRTADSVKGTDHFFGVRDYGSSSTRYPIHETDLVSHTLTQNASNNRLLAASPVPATSSGWMIPLNITGITGERDVVTATPLYSAGAAVLTSLIPGQNNDPCTPGRLGAIMAVNASTGGPAVVPQGTAAGAAVVVGAQVNNPPTVGSTVVVSPIGGGSVIVPGVGVVGGGDNGSLTISGGLPVWRRTSWRELLNNL